MNAPVDDASAIALHWPARLSLAWEKQSERSVLVHRAHEGPLRVQKPLYPEGDGVCHTILLHPPGGVAGGDVLDVSLDVRAGARALVTTPGAGKWYGAAHESDGARWTQRIVVHAGATLEWLPQENMLFDRARAEITLEVDVAPSARVAMWDIWCLGRAARAERFEHGEWINRLDLRIGGAPALIERARLAGNDPLLAARVGLDGNRAFGTLIIAGPRDGDDASSLANVMRDVSVPQDVSVGVTDLADSLADCIAMPYTLCVARAVSNRVEGVRAVLEAMWLAVRAPLTGVRATRPRIWAT